MGKIADFWSNTKDTVTESATNAWGKVRSTTANLNPEKRTGELIEGMGDTPIVGKMTPEDVADTAKNPEKSKLGEGFEKLTGIDLGGFSGNKLANHLSNKLAGLADLIIGTLMACIEKLIMKLLRKFPLLAALLFLDETIGDFIGKYKRIADDFIEKQIKNLLYRVLKVQQLAALNRKLTEMIRGICEKSSAKDLRGWTNDLTLAKYVSEASVEDLKKAITEEAADQGGGYPARGPDMFVNADGSLKTTSQRLADAEDTLNIINEDAGSGPDAPIRLENLTVEQAIAVKALIEEIARLKQIDIDEKDLSAVTC